MPAIIDNALFHLAFQIAIQKACYHQSEVLNTILNFNF